MKITLIGSRYFGRAVLDLLLKEPGIEIARVAVPSADDRLAEGARAAGIDVFVHENPHVVPIEAIAPGTDLIVTAHSHARVAHDAVESARLGGIGYHPSLLPRHRGMAAVEWTVKEADPIAGGTIYHLADKLDAGPIAAQDWVFVRKGEGARELWERALAPLGLRLLLEVVRHARDEGELPATPQDEQFATRAPRLD
jgi:methionyl-tRNA formyltransferase